MERNEKGIFSDVKFWKLGCNWGSNEPSFYSVLSKENAVIRHGDRGDYGMGDLVLVTEGHSVLAIAKVKSEPIPINTNAYLLNELKNCNVDDFNRISYYKVEFFELPKNANFKYKLQQGIVEVHQNDIKEKATELWLSKNAMLLRINVSCV